MKPALTNQELLDRYIHSFRMMLPPDKVEDIAAEIRSNLESLAEDLHPKVEAKRMLQGMSHPDAPPPRHTAALAIRNQATPSTSIREKSSTAKAGPR